MNNIKEKINLKIEEEPLVYSIDIGNDILSNIDQLIAKIDSGGRIFLVTDENVNKIYGDQITSVLKEAGYELTLYILPPGEKAKSFKYLQKGYDLLIDNNFQRDDMVVAFGGGVVGDLAGYLAASFMRGISLIQIPTTLLAQVDSSVGGKTAINHEQGKNLIGAFYQPDRVIIDVSLLKTLPERELKTGMAEVIKYGIIADQEFFNFLMNHKKDVYNLKEETIIKIVNKSCSIKADIVIKDQKEKGERAFLNFGHTIGHSLEAISNYDKFTHGEAVAVGMRGEARLSNSLDYINDKQLEQIETILKLYELPLTIDTNRIEQMYQAMKHDKKAQDNKLRWVLVNEIGNVFIKKGIEKQIILEVLEGLK